VEAISWGVIIKISFVKAEKLVKLAGTEFILAGVIEFILIINNFKLKVCCILDASLKASRCTAGVREVKAVHSSCKTEDARSQTNTLFQLCES
jgi:hypothetical protein